MGAEGGQATAKINREKAIKEYYLNPKICKFCKNIIHVNTNQKVTTTKRKTFCDLQCCHAYKFSRKKEDPIPDQKNKNCIVCNKEIICFRKKNGNLQQKKYCDVCRKRSRYWDILPKLTKGEIFKRYDRYYIGRSQIRKHASKVYYQQNSKKECKICGYDKHIEVCHIKPVSEFDDNVLLTEINNIQNLIGLCPNHHWEYDHDILKLNCGIE